ncbi:MULTISPECIES: diacylglycerol kinase family protein [Chryseobacterium]|uniref:Diacylglycerol kinase n=1 Tax=Chryseobacterium camelliae TaxID=1265445 RepID=A0ABU0TGY6_9FLAO|nr:MULTISPECIES: diacylglycerol kinase family protein [Chryseobacterium]MDT3406677.1 diacylglycerol kinase [Pseudacidovorax intermedius]MDQ1095525.1 diacylglycerol kinase [Chryseobacterium camelliae]MDQ1099462.1 diacylglycerol kinase [Chryseobacterium sp. SORGH_AS_1048]MDR6086808.1 diacylglycerol kinase [Chryseobacterium sp. SORGH_AS_0909]MDR6131181.1 diacylglycerol kinase [Chryseobacterium sp. SORGH_AS_1175]
MRKPPVHKSFLNAFRGIFLMVKSERNFKIELFAFVLNIVLIFYFHLSYFDTALILLVSFAVLAAEMFNTSIEKICDVVHPEFDKRIGFIKDVSAGAVLLMAIASVLVGIMVYGKYILPI